MSPTIMKCVVAIKSAAFVGVANIAGALGKFDGALAAVNIVERRTWI